MGLVTKKTVLLGVSGGIAAVKVPELIKLLRKEAIEVLPVMTKSACRIVDPEVVEKASKHQVYTDLFGLDFDSKRVLKNRRVDHIEVADKADLAVVVPTTANVLGKLANGIADDFLTTTLLATACPILLWPSMNVHMWQNPVVQENINRLRRYGYVILEPVSGDLACGYEGVGRLPDITMIKKEIVTLLNKTTVLKGRTIIVTAGGTTEAIDEVRTITNRSSGKMGVAMAEVCYLRGAKVLLLRAKNSVLPRYSMEEHVFETADELLAQLRTLVPKADICFHVAAVSDFAVEKRQGKVGSDRSMTLTLVPRQKLYKQIKTINPGVFLITFKAEWHKTGKELERIARATLLREPMEVIVVNDVGGPDRGFEVDTNEVIVFGKRKKRRLLSLKSKRDLAGEIVDYLFHERNDL